MAEIVDTADYFAKGWQDYDAHHDDVRFISEPFYAEDADSVIFFVRETPTYRKRLNSLITLYLSMDDHRIAGFEVKSVHRILQMVKAFKVWVVDEKIKLGILLSMGLVQVSEPEVTKYASDLIQYSDIEVPVPKMAA
jgi:hypothetical protein